MRSQAKRGDSLGCSVAALRQNRPTKLAGKLKDICRMRKVGNSIMLPS